MKIKIIRHKTLAAILKAYFDGDKPDERGIWTWYDASGKKNMMSMPIFKKTVSKRGVWAFVLGKKELHIWIGKRCLFHDLLADLGMNSGILNSLGQNLEDASRKLKPLNTSA